MQLVERHVSKRADPRFAAIDRAACASKNLYNAANYVVRQSCIREGVSLNYHEMHRRLQDHEAYRALPAKVAQWVLRLLDKNWQSYFAAGAAWEQDPSKFLGHPKLPGYKEQQTGRNLWVYTIQALSVPALRQGVIAPSRLGITVPPQQQDVQQVRIIPRDGFYVVEVIYEQPPIQTAVDPALHAGVDMGLNNLATLTADKPGFVPRIVNGRPVKSSRATSSTTSGARSGKAGWERSAPVGAWSASPPSARGGLTTACTPPAHRQPPHHRPAGG
jgi:putative transposase